MHNEGYGKCKCCDSNDDDDDDEEKGGNLPGVPEHGEDVCIERMH